MPLMTWATHVLQWREQREANERSGANPRKHVPVRTVVCNSDYTKLESLVIADQNAAVNTFPGLVHTARHTMGVGNARSQWPNRKEGAVEGRSGNWGEVVTR